MASESLALPSCNSNAQIIKGPTGATEKTEAVGGVQKMKRPKTQRLPKALALPTSKYRENTAEENYFCKVDAFAGGVLEKTKDKPFLSWKFTLGSCPLHEAKIQEMQSS